MSKIEEEEDGGDLHNVKMYAMDNYRLEVWLNYLCYPNYGCRHGRGYICITIIVPGFITSFIVVH